MARTAVLRDQKRINVSIESDLHWAAKQRAADLRIKGGFSEYIARLLVGDLQKERSLARNNSRHLPNKRTVR